jgi:hypothetical protein
LFFVSCFFGWLNSEFIFYVGMLRLSHNGMWLAEVGEFEVGCSCLVGCLKKAEMLKLALLPQFWQTTVVRRLVYFIL